MAQSSVAVQREKLGLEDESMTGAQVAELLQQISLGLKVLIGKGTTARLVADIWQVLSVGESDR
jgi:hypothetical protein